jgi:hypothetical protein
LTPVFHLIVDIWFRSGATSTEPLWTSETTPRDKRIVSSEANAMSDWSDEKTDDPLYADDRNFYKVELWTKDEQRVLHMLYAGNNLDKARTILGNYMKYARAPASPFGSEREC